MPTTKFTEKKSVKGLPPFPRAKGFRVIPKKGFQKQQFTKARKKQQFTKAKQFKMAVAIVSHSFYLFTSKFYLLPLSNWTLKFYDYFIMTEQSTGHVQLSTGHVQVKKNPMYRVYVQYSFVDDVKFASIDSRGGQSFR